MKTSNAALGIAVCLAIFCCVYSEENVEAQHEASSAHDLADSQIHMAKKRSAEADLPDSLILNDEGSYYPIDDADLDKRSSLFRFGKRQWRYGKRQFRYGKRQFRYGKRGGTLFRFGRSGGIPEGEERQAALRAVLEGYYAPQDDDLDLVMAKRSHPAGFHWGSDV